MTKQMGPFTIGDSGSKGYDILSTILATPL